MEKVRHSGGCQHLIVPAAQFKLLSGADDLVFYQFNTRVAKHLSCRHALLL